MSGDPVDEAPPPPPALRLMTGASTAVLLCWLIIDIGWAFPHARAESTEDRLAGIAALLGAACLAGALAQCAVAIQLLWARWIGRLVRRPGALLCALPVVVALIVHAAPRLEDRVSAAMAGPLALVGVLAAFALVLVLAIRPLARVVLDRGSPTWQIGVLALGGAWLSFVIDARLASGPVNQPIRDVLAAVGIALAAVFGAAFLRTSWRLLGVPTLACAAIFVWSCATGGLPGEEDPVRSLLTRQSRLTSMLFDAPPEPRVDRPESYDAALLAELARSRRIDPDRLDRLVPDRRTAPVVVVTVEAHGEAPTMPLDDAAASFRAAWSTSPRAITALRSMMSSRYDSTLEDVPTLAGMLAESGRPSLAFTAFAAERLDELEDCVRGFHRNRNETARDVESTRRNVSRAVAALDAAPDGAGPFIWLHVAEDGVSAADTREHLEPLFERLRRRDGAVVIRVGLRSTLDIPFDLASLGEDRIRIAMSITARGVVGGPSDHPVDLVDLVPTIAEYVALERPAGVVGQSLLPILLAEPAESRPPPIAYCRLDDEADGRALEAVRHGDWKLVVDPEARAARLFELVADPLEQTDVSEARPRIVRRLEEVLATVRRHAQIDLGPRAAGPRDVLEAFASGQNAEVGTRALAAALRDGPLERSDVLPRLLEHPDPLVRRLAHLHVVRHADPLGRALLTRRLMGDATDELRDLAALSLVLLGEDDLFDPEFRTRPALRGSNRPLVELAAYLAGEEERGPAVHHILRGGANDPDAESAMLMALLRAGDPELPITAYVRLMTAKADPDLPRAALKIATSMPFHIAAPLVRTLLDVDDPRIAREIAEFVARNPERARWRAGAERTNAAIARMRARLASGERLEAAAAEVLASVGRHEDGTPPDWGVMLDLLAAACEADAVEEIIELAFPAFLGAASAPVLARGKRDRVIALSRSAGGPLRANLAEVHGQMPSHGEAGRLDILFSLSVPAGARALMSRAEDADLRLQATIRGRDGIVRGPALARPLPPLGVLPGETRIVAVPLLLPRDVETPMILDVRLEVPGRPPVARFRTTID